MGSLKFRVVIDTEKEEDIFRDILIGEQLSFENLFHSIMNAFDFEGNQLASFYLSNDMWDKGREIGLLDMGIDEDDAVMDEDAPLVMSKAILGEHCLKVGQKVILVYDFLNMWCFLIELVGKEEKEVTEAELLISVGLAPNESDRDSSNAGEDFDFDLYADEDDEYDDEFGDFENIDDLDI